MTSTFVTLGWTSSSLLFNADDDLRLMACTHFQNWEALSVDVSFPRVASKSPRLDEIRTREGNGLSWTCVGPLSPWRITSADFEIRAFDNLSYSQACDNVSHRLAAV